VPKWGSIFIDVFEELDTVSMVITFLVGRGTHCNELWTPNAVANMEAIARSSQTKPGMLPMRAPRSKGWQKMLTDVRNNNI
jgi:hypothetical protein